MAILTVMAQMVDRVREKMAGVSYCASQIVIIIGFSLQLSVRISLFAVFPNTADFLYNSKYLSSCVYLLTWSQFL